MAAVQDRAFAHSAFSVLTEPHGRALVVRTFGEVDIASAKSLEKAIRSAFESDAEAVLLDLGEVSFIDSAGLSVLVAVTAVSNSNGRRLRIVRVSSAIQREFEVSGLGESFPLAD
jgi:anti-sigma B factor antagonist